MSVPYEVRLGYRFFDLSSTSSSSRLCSDERVYTYELKLDCGHEAWRRRRVDGTGKPPARVLCKKCHPKQEKHGRPDLEEVEGQVDGS